MANNKPHPQRQLFIGNLSYDATEKELAALLEAAGVFVFRVRIVTDQDTGRPRGFAFVDLDHTELKSVEEIIEHLNHVEPVSIHGRIIRADKANSKPRGERQEKPRGGRGHARSEAAPLGNEFSDEDPWR
jgi:RNA recognition motif-containing protein